jgi:hypothetical protein
MRQNRESKWVERGRIRRKNVCKEAEWEEKMDGGKRQKREKNRNGRNKAEYNKFNVRSHSQIGIILQLPTNDDLSKWKHKGAILAPAGIKKLYPMVSKAEKFATTCVERSKSWYGPENEVKMYGKIAAKR